MIIYKITNLINGKAYIGQTTTTLEERWRAHCSKSSRCTAIRRAIEKYGKENFKVEQIDVAVDLDELNHKETYYINLYDTLAPNGYNLNTGGDNRLYSEESKRRISENHADVSGENNPMYGIKRPEVGELNKKLKSRPVRCIETGLIYVSLIEAQRQTGIDRSHIGSVCKGKYGCRTAGGYHWEYVS